MPKLKLTAVAVLTATASLLTAPAVAGPWLAPWALGHVIGAAARLATRPIIAASAASAAGQPRPVPLPYGTPAPVQYAAAGYYGPPAYGPPPAYYAPRFGYYGVPPVSVYRSRSPYVAAMPLLSSRYSAAGMRYSGAYGRAAFSPSRGFAYRRW